MHPRDLFLSGLTDLIPISPGKKFPTAKGWPQYVASLDDIERWHAKGYGTGLKSARFPGIDIDTDSELLQEVVIALAREHLGASPVRIGRRPLLPYRLADGEAPVRKSRITLRGGGAIEILGDGQQYVVCGTHPDTGKAYEWHGGADLTHITSEQLANFRDALCDTLDALGELESIKSAPGEGTRAEIERAPNYREWARALLDIPNDDLPYDEWIAVMHAAKGALPEDAERELGRDVWLYWCARSAKDVPSESERVWDACTDVQYSSWPQLVRRATPEVQAASEFAREIVPVRNTFASRGEHLASLLRSPDRVFLREILTLEPREVQPRFEALLAASQIEHPLTPAMHVAMDTLASGDLRLSTDFEHLFIARAARACPREVPVSDRELVGEAIYLSAVKLTALLRMHELPAIAAESEVVPLLHEPLNPGAALIARRSLTCIAGAPGSMKSFIATRLAYSIASGAESFAGHTIHDPGPVWYFTSEHVQGLMKRVRAMGPASENLVILQRVPNLQSTESVIESIKSASAYRPDPRLIVIDIFADAIRGDENDADVVGAAMLNAQVMASVTGAAVIVVHHTRKGDDQEPRGSSALRAKVDQLFFTEKKGDDKVVFKRGDRGKHRDGMHLWYRFRIENGTIVEDGPSAGQTDTQARRESEDSELARIAAHGIANGDTVRAIARMLKENGNDYGLSDRPLRERIVSVLEEIAIPNGWVQKGPDGKFIAIS